MEFPPEVAGTEGPQWARCVAQLRSFSTLGELRASAFFQEYGDRIRQRLAVPEIQVCPSALPRLRSFLRVVQWNIEKGKRFDRILHTLETHEVLRLADVILLNEADLGMARSGNRHVALDLAHSLEMHVAFGASHVELTKGTECDLLAPGDNRVGLQGNAVLSRHPILDARITPLPVCFEPFHFHEKRYGTRNCAWAKIQVEGTVWWIGSVHLEVRDRPRCRALQMKHLVDSLPDEGAAPCLVGGDLNSNGFERGTRRRAIQSVLRLTAGDPRVIEEKLIRPQFGAEPLFDEARKAGFYWQGFNGASATARAKLDGLEDAALLPAWIRRLVERRLRPYGGMLQLKLDWLLGRGCRALRKGEAVDAGSGVATVDPGIAVPMENATDPVSDHLPIFADLSLNGE